MASLNTIWSVAPNKGLFINSDTSQFIISGYRLIVDPLFNRDTLKVTPPTASNSIGERGNTAFDDHHLYYCIGINKWVRAKLAYWEEENNADVKPGLTSPSQTYIPIPNNSWKLTSNGTDGIGEYHFYSYGPSRFDTVSGYSNDLGGYLLNSTSNLIEPSTLNENFTLSFETKRPSMPALDHRFFMGTPFGKLGFYLSWVNPDSKTLDGGYPTNGDYLNFSFNTHKTVSGVTNFFYRWLGQTTLTPPSTSQFCQVVVTNEAATKLIKFYVNGILQSTASYAPPYMNVGQNIGSIYQNPSYEGWGIGASPNGSARRNPAASVEYYSKVDGLRYMLFWKGITLNQAQVTQLYNNGNFIRYEYGRTVAGLMGDYSNAGGSNPAGEGE
jgi:hypothetical protein